jgi:putative redox protein
MSKVSVTWNGGLYFTGDDNRGHTVPLESAAATDGQNRGFLPSELLLTALGACTGMDTVSLLARYGAKVEEFRVELSGVKRAEPAG